LSPSPSINLPNAWLRAGLLLEYMGFIDLKEIYWFDIKKLVLFSGNGEKEERKEKSYSDFR
jgi:hypothetical protein